MLVVLRLQWIRPIFPQLTAWELSAREQHIECLLGSTLVCLPRQKTTLCDDDIHNSAVSLDDNLTTSNDIIHDIIWAWNIPLYNTKISFRAKVFTCLTLPWQFLLQRVLVVKGGGRFLSWIITRYFTFAFHLMSNIGYFNLIVLGYGKFLFLVR